jgi:hypothetical protein
VNHPTGGSDDAGNAVFGLCYLLKGKIGMRGVPLSAYDAAMLYKEGVKLSFKWSFQIP